MALNFSSCSFPTIHPNATIVVHNPIPNLASCTHNQLCFLPQLQDFRYFVVVDFEATCDKDRIPCPQEIIEFPSVIISGTTGWIKACFQTYVRPSCNPVLTEFCKELTGIQQFQVDKGIGLREALFFHDRWLEQMGVKNTNFAVVTWSNWDCQVMLESECRFKNIPKPDYFNRWINLRIPFSHIFGNVRCNLKQAVELSGLIWQGRVHCGLDDAINISRLFSVIMHKGYKFFVTKSLLKPKPPQLLESQRTTPLQLLPCHQKISPPPNISYNLEDIRHCFCGVRSLKKIMKRPGPEEGKFFFGCGRWTTTRGACCHYFEWAT